MATGHVKTFRSQKYKIKTTKPVPRSWLEGTEFFECLNFSLILNQNKRYPRIPLRFELKTFLKFKKMRYIYPISSCMTKKPGFSGVPFCAPRLKIL